MNKFKNMIERSEKLITSSDVTRFKKYACKIKVSTVTATYR